MNTVISWLSVMDRVFFWWIVLALPANFILGTQGRWFNSLVALISVWFITREWYVGERRGAWATWLPIRRHVNLTS